MKPNFALHFTDDSVSLLRRTKRGWTEVGQSAFDVADLSAALGLKVEISDKAGRGEVRIHYAALEQLDEICRRLSRR